MELVLLLTRHKYQITPFLLGVFFVSLVGLFLWFRQKSRQKRNSKKDTFELTRYSYNPILTTIAHNEHETTAVFNPSVVLGKDNKFHMLYRAIGSDGISRIGYARSEDGYSFDLRTPFAVLEGSDIIPQTIDPTVYDFSKNPSGGSSFGLEDPRITEIDGIIYMMINLFGGWDFMKIGLTSISENDLLNRRFNWKKIKIISPNNERHKNWSLFPEKINGKYAVLHGISPEIMIDYVDSLDTPFIINSPRREGTQKGRNDFWDTHVRSAGPAPLKTDKGWLILYHANDKREPHKYKLGALLLDLQDPTKILHRSNQPILVPDMHYENEGKPGIVYACGSVIKNDKLLVYYGGGDQCCCVAEADINKLVSWLTS